MSEAISLPATAIDLTPAHSKWEVEYQAFLRLLPQLLTTHRALYVAIHNGQVVDSGDEKLALTLRVLAKVGNVPIHVGLVTEEPEPVFRSGVRHLRSGWYHTINAFVPGAGGCSQPASANRRSCCQPR